MACPDELGGGRNGERASGLRYENAHVSGNGKAHFGDTYHVGFENTLGCLPHAEDAPYLLVVDALDECDDETNIRIIVQLLAEARSLEGVRLRVFLTSRREVPIRQGILRISDSELRFEMLRTFYIREHGVYNVYFNVFVIRRDPRPSMAVIGGYLSAISFFYVIPRAIANYYTSPHRRQLR